MYNGLTLYFRKNQNDIKINKHPIKSCFIASGLNDLLMIRRKVDIGKDDIYYCSIIYQITDSTTTKQALLHFDQN